MILQITSNTVDVDEHLSDFIDKRFTIPLDKYLKHFDDDMKKAVLRIEKGSRFGFEVIFDMQLPGRGTIYSKESGKDLQGLIIALREEVERQIKTYKDRISAPKRY